MNLEEFLHRTEIPRRAWVTHPDFVSLYARVTKRYNDLENLVDTIDIASIEAKNPGRGSFSRLITYLTEKYPQYIIYIESVQNKRFAEYLRFHGFIESGDSELPNFWY